MSTNNNTPQLRFPEFSGEWEEKKLGEVCERITDKVGNLYLEPISVSAGIGIISQKQRFGKDISGVQYKNYIHIKKGDYCYNKGNSKRFPQGCIYELKDFEEAAAPNAFISFRFNNTMCPQFFNGYFDSNAHGKQLAKFITSGARADGLLNLNAEDFFKIKFYVPPTRAEQQKIAQCLTEMDNLITAQGHIVEALKEKKKGLMQQMFPQQGETTPRLRFPGFSGEWGKTTLGEIADKKNRRNNKQEVTRVLTNSANSGIVDQSDYFDRDIAVKGNTDNYFIVEIDDFVYNPRISTAAPVGPISINRVGRGIMSPLYTVFKFHTGYIPFYEQYFQTTIWHTYLKSIANYGARFDRMNITTEGFFNMPLLLPTPSEQQKIAEFLSSLDDLIAAETAKLETLKDHKKGLMQQLFPQTIK